MLQRFASFIRNLLGGCKPKDNEPLHLIFAAAPDVGRVVPPGGDIPALLKGPVGGGRVYEWLADSYVSARHNSDVLVGGPAAGCITSTESLARTFDRDGYL